MQSEANESRAMAYGLELIRIGVLSIDSEGRIWREKIKVSRTGEWKHLKIRRRAECRSGRGYLRITLGFEGATHSVQAHRLIWASIKGPIPHHLQVNHKDLNKANNRIDNLELVTQSENIQHSYDNGRTVPWSQATIWRDKPLLTDEQKSRMRERRASGRKLRDIAREFGVSITHAHRVTSCQA